VTPDACGYTELMRQSYPLVKAANPAITVNVQTVNWTDFPNKVQTLVQNKQFPDILEGDTARGEIPDDSFDVIDLEMHHRLATGRGLPSPDRQLRPFPGAEPKACRGLVEERQSKLFLVERLCLVDVRHHQRRDGQELGEHRRHLDHRTGPGADGARLILWAWTSTSARTRVWARAQLPVPAEASRTRHSGRKTSGARDGSLTGLQARR